MQTVSRPKSTCPHVHFLESQAFRAIRVHDKLCLSRRGLVDSTLYCPENCVLLTIEPEMHRCYIVSNSGKLVRFLTPQVLVSVKEDFPERFVPQHLSSSIFIVISIGTTREMKDILGLARSSCDAECQPTTSAFACWHYGSRDVSEPRQHTERGRQQTRDLEELR